MAVKAAEPAYVATVAGEMVTLKPTDGATPEGADMATSAEGLPDMTAKGPPPDPATKSLPIPPPI